ncbi:MAG: lipoprotein N-acyltransferase Lnb domain-containing protein [Pseudomarimonas sp.]
MHGLVARIIEKAGRTRAGVDRGLHHCLLLFALLVGATGLSAAPRIGVLTMDPGEEYWSRYGHNAILIVEGERATSYNFGYFDFDQPGFLTRFLQGDMRYRLAALPYQVDMAGYATDGRGVRVQWLALADQQAEQLAAALATNALPENAEYRYDYYVSNCSTKVRDELDAVLGGELKRQLSGRSHGLTFRDESLRLASPVPWMAVGIHFGLGPATDRPMSLWDEAFVPARLASALETLQIDGKALVQSSAEMLPAQRDPAPEAAPRWMPAFAMAGAALVAFLMLAFRTQRDAWQRLGVLATASFWLCCGLAGSGLLALWLATDHSAAWANHNALLANPLCLLMVAALPSLWRGQPVATWLRWLSMVIVAGAIASVFKGWLGMRGQHQLEWILLLLPAHLMLMWQLRGVGRSAEASVR